jgi:hypothetical protein
MGHHLTDDGQFKSDRHPDLPAGKIVLSFRDPHAQLGLWVTAIDYRAHDPELSADMVTALARLGSAPPRAAVEDAWAWSLAREQGIDPRETVRAFVRVPDEDAPLELHLVGGSAAVSAIRMVLGGDRPTFRIYGEDVSVEVFEHALVAGEEAPPRAATDDGRPDFDGFLLALRAEGQWSAALHAEDKTGQAAADQRALHELAQHVEAVGKKLGFLPVTRSAGEPQGRDWTTSEEGIANSSALFQSLEKRVAEIIVNSAHSLLSGHAETVAGLILAKLAHEHGLSPRGPFATAPKAPSAIHRRPQALAKWLREVADDVANLKNSSDRTNAECVSNLRATVDILPNGPLCESIRNLADQVASGRLERGSTDVTTIANLRAAADALERGVNLDMMEAHDAPLLAGDPAWRQTVEGMELKGGS